MTLKNHVTEQRLRQIDAISRSEPLGSQLFFVHFGCLCLGAIATVYLFDIWMFFWIFLVYLVFFVLEKTFSNYAVKNQIDAFLPVCLAFLFLRASAYDAIAIALWTFESSVFRMGTLAMVAASTLNLMINQVSFFATMACVAVPNLFVFFAISWLVYSDSGISPDFLGSAVVITCVLPYFFLSLSRARNRWAEQEQTKLELQRSQRLESMGKVASGVSHDFNNILSVVSGSLQLIDKSEDEAERHELTRIALRAIEHGSGLTKQMLALGRRSPLVPKAIDLNEAVVEFEDFVSRILPANIEVTCDLSKENPTILIDPGMLQNALLNLALNSKAAMPTGGRLSIEVDVQRVPENFPLSHAFDGECAVLTITDSGQGISKQDIEFVFEPFFTTREVGKGSGLGLSMVKGFTDQSNGWIDIKSELAVGTTIRLYLPLTSDRISSETVQPNVHTTAPFESSKRPVLVVEDNPQLLKLIELKLRKDNFTVIGKESGDEAIGLLRDDSGISLVVTDLVMPGVHQGIDILDRAKALREPIPVILMSGYADVRTANEEQLKRADRFIEKPMSLEHLSTEIDGLIRGN